jgi:hypothetical protein
VWLVLEGDSFVDTPQSGTYTRLEMVGAPYDTRSLNLGLLYLGVAAA